jgi:general secretion pathway protein B
MSFILDALKKSETDRQRQNGPALFEVRVAPPRNGLPLWAVGLAVLLAVNLVIVAWVLLRRPAQVEAVAAAPVAPPQAAYALAPVGAGGAPPVATIAAAGQAGAQQGPAMAPLPAAVPVGGTAPTAPVGQTAAMTQPPPSGAPAGVAPGAAGSQLPANVSAASNVGNDAPPADAPEGKSNPDDYAPAAEPGAPAGFGNHVSRGTTNGVPLYQDAALAPGSHIPELRLDLHVFAAKPQDRFVMINMHKLHEGDSLPEGVRVESITPEGAVLTHAGTRFFLPRE